MSALRGLRLLLEPGNTGNSGAVPAGRSARAAGIATAPAQACLPWASAVTFQVTADWSNSELPARKHLWCFLVFTQASPFSEPSAGREWGDDPPDQQLGLAPYSCWSVGSSKGEGKSSPGAPLNHSFWQRLLLHLFSCNTKVFPSSLWSKMSMRSRFLWAGHKDNPLKIQKHPVADAETKCRFYEFSFSFEVFAPCSVRG